MYDKNENIAGTLGKLLENVLMPREWVDAFSKALRSLFENIVTIPDDVKQTYFFEKVQKLSKLNLRYEEVVWIIDDYGYNYEDQDWKDVSKSNQSDLHRYTGEVVLSTSINKREKILILLAHIEPLIYETLDIAKEKNSKLKDDVKEVTISKNKGFSADGIGKLFVLAIMYIVFANTDSYTEEVDKRMPFRNNILHNGIVMYSDEEVSIMYELLVCLIGILIDLSK